VIPLGYLRDCRCSSPKSPAYQQRLTTDVVTGNMYPRDIGRSTSFDGGAILFQFGDTFSHGAAGKFQGTTSSTCAMAPHSLTPTLSMYTEHEADGKVSSFIPMFPDEADRPGKRSTFWGFGGIAQGPDSEPEKHTGWVWFQKGIFQSFNNEVKHELQYTGIAMVEFEPRIPKITVTRRQEEAEFRALFKASRTNQDREVEY
jgi:hypothetical protein